MYKNEMGQWVVVGRIPQQVKVEIAPRDARDFFAQVLMEQNGGYDAMVSMPIKERAFFDALSNIMMKDMDDVAAVKETNDGLGTSLKVSSFRKWLPELMREFGRATREG